ncbi:hypothetical protein CVT24_010801 [Panaeolus cyanescens]|uniref:Transmembrane protein n=1 Tax=Panaeolus cyanescens TaxID=181874 RepID=A0A409VGZ7_9AGAR|nr:hypothetical protein CVT24_010801 [Panaeolus cyanescens]
MWIWNKRRADGRPSSVPALISLILVVLMWIVSCITIRRFLRVFIFELVVGGDAPHKRVRDAVQWDHQANMALVGVMIILGDILVIHRTYIAWDRNWWVVLFPILIDVANIVVVGVSFYGLANPGRFSVKTAYALYAPGFPLAFLQNVVTTGLLWYKIWSQHRESTRNGVARSDGGISLGYLAQILFETAMIYPIQLLIIITLNVLFHPAASMVAIIMVPCIGMVFVLLTVRVYFATKTPNSRQNSSTIDFPSRLLTSQPGGSKAEDFPPASAASPHARGDHAT